MYCRNCGENINENAEFCIKCGFRKNNGTSFCQNCGVETNEKQELCINCGVRLKKYTEPSKINTIFDGDGTENYDFTCLSPYYELEFTRMKEQPLYKGQFNWPAFLFGCLWMLSKGMFIQAIIWILLSTFVSYFTFGLAGIVLCVICGLRANYMYYNHYTKKQIKMF